MTLRVGGQVCGGNRARPAWGVPEQTPDCSPRSGRDCRRPLRFVTYLAPNMRPVYGFIARYVGERLDLPTELAVGFSYQGLAARGDVSFLCGLPYVELRDGGEPGLEPLAAPVLQGERYAGKPVYFSDVIVHRRSRFQSFADLRGCSWAYNEPHSHSGFGVTRHRLAQLGETAGYFGRLVEAGWHERSIDLVRAGDVDASAIDSHVLAVAMRDRPCLVRELRVIESLGPSPIQPVVASPHLPESLKADLRNLLVEMADDSGARESLKQGLVERFVPVCDATYDPIRDMMAAAAAVGFNTLAPTW